MAFYVVCQNIKHYPTEKNGGYIWAPKQNEKGHTRECWTLVSKVKKGDIIFSYQKKKIIAISKVISDGVEADKPYGLDNDSKWQKEGWMAKVKYKELLEPLELVKHKEIIEKFRIGSGSDYPFDINGEGKTGYFFKIPQELAKYFWDKSKK